MSLRIASLNSGSNGNSYYIGNETEAVLVDAGLSCRETERRLANLQLSPSLIQAVFISHEHTDHIKGVEVLAKKYQLPVYITPRTLSAGRLNLSSSLVRHFESDEVISIGGLTVTAFGKYHDASDPHSFTVSGNGVTIGVLTDIGDCCERVVHHFSRCDAAFLEANYDDQMLENGRYPWPLKNRIRNGKGHLSNAKALELFLNHRSESLSHLLLSHLSRDNNSPELVKELFENVAGNTFVDVASRYDASPVFHIVQGQFPEKTIVQKSPEKIQLKLF